MPMRRSQPRSVLLAPFFDPIFPRFSRPQVLCACPSTPLRARPARLICIRVYPRMRAHCAVRLVRRAGLIVSYDGSGAASLRARPRILYAHANVLNFNSVQDVHRQRTPFFCDSSAHCYSRGGAGKGRYAAC